MSIEERTKDSLGFERNVTAASGAVFLVGLGEELWKKFLPKYLESLGASVAAVGLFGTAEDFFDAIYQYPGGWLADHWGRRRAFLIFLAAAIAGYFIYLSSPSWPYLFLGLAFVMAWQAMGSLVLAACAALLLFSLRLPTSAGDTAKIIGVWNSFHPTLKRLLASDIVIRMCEGLADIFVVLYATNIIGVTIPEYGVLVAIQLMTAILIYVPSAKIAGRVGRKPFVIATFFCFAMYPIAAILAHNFGGLVVAFIVGGLREIGEPSRKAMIVDFAEQQLRARTVGLYYLVRSLSITPASAIGGLLWKVRPEIPFVAAGLIGFAGTLLFAITVDEQHAA